MDLLPTFPVRQHLLKFVHKELQTAAKEPHAVLGDTPLLELPQNATDETASSRKFGKTVNAFGPLKAFRQIKFARHLHDTKSTRSAIDDAFDASVSDEDVAAATKLKSRESRIMHKSNLQRSRLRLDSTTMNLDRRWFAELAKNNRQGVVSMHLFTDASPVTRHELQGVILQVYLRIALSLFLWCCQLACYTTLAQRSRPNCLHSCGRCI